MLDTLNTDATSPAAQMLALFLLDPTTMTDEVIADIPLDAYGTDQPGDRTLAELMFKMQREHESGVGPFVTPQAIHMRLVREGWPQGTSRPRLEYLARNPPLESVEQIRPFMLEAYQRHMIEAAVADLSRSVYGREPMSAILSKVAAIGETDTYMRVKSAEGYALAALERVENPRAPLPHGLPNMERFFPGIPRGQLTVIAAPTSGGKSLTCGQIVRGNMKVGNRVAYASLEDGTTRTILRMLRAETGITPQMDGLRLMPSQRESAQKFVDNFDYSLYVPIETRHLSEIIAVCRKTKPDLLVIDQLSHLDFPRLRGEPQDEYIGRMMKFIVSEIVSETGLGLTVLLVHQLNREATRSGEPQIWHMANAAAVERDADNIMLLWREIDPESGTPSATEIQFKVGKQRDGPTGRSTARFHGPTFTISA